MPSLPIASTGFNRYVSNPELADANTLSVPSQNCFITDEGTVEGRLGYTSEFSVGVSGSAATAFYHRTYDLAFFALGTKLYYRDHTRNETIDTGITLTSGTHTRFDEFMGDVYLSNTTDGMRRIVVMRLNDSAPNQGDSTVTVDADGASRLSVFGNTTGNLRIRGTNEAYNAVNAGTGVITLTGTLTRTYSDNDVAIVVHDISSGREKASKLLFWKSRLHLMGFPSTTNADQPNNTVMAGQFVIGQTGATGIELIIDFTFGTGGSTKITVGSGGKVTNILGVGDSIYFFTEQRVFSTLAANIDVSGSSIGLTIPIEKDPLHGCLNEDCATVADRNSIIYATHDNKIVRIPIDTESGAAISAPEEDFDVDIREHLKNLSKDQTGAFVYHYKGGRKTICQLKEAGQWKWFIFDHSVVRSQGSNFVRGAWQPPQRVVPVKSLFERNGVLWGTDLSTDKVYSFFTSFLDDIAPVNVTIATGEFDVGSASMQKCYVKGKISHAARIRGRTYVWNNRRGKTSGSEKRINGSSFTYGQNQGVGALAVGDGGVGPTVQTAFWDKDWDIYPSEANRCQLVLENDSGGYCSLTSFALAGTQYAGSFSASI